MTSFENSGLNPEVLKAIADLGFTTPTPVQAQTLPILLSGDEDLVALAQTGTGKTAAFGLPMLNRINQKNKDTQALILCPTRELCLQITNDLTAFAKYMPQVYITAIYGGAPIGVQARQLSKGSQIVVGTPGRVVDMISRGALIIDKVNCFVLDEAMPVQRQHHRCVGAGQRRERNTGQGEPVGNHLRFNCIQKIHDSTPSDCC